MAIETRYRVLASALNIRKAPNTSTAAVGYVRRDDVLVSLGDSDDGLWIMIMRDGFPGWVSKKYLERLPNFPEGSEDFGWMAIATRERGVSGQPGPANNLRVLEYLRSARNLGTLATSRDETSWCSAFVNWCVERAGYVGTRSALALSWLEWGRATRTPRTGCIVIFSRTGGFGHVGFYLGEIENDVLVLGGNQHNPETNRYEVNVRRYPKGRLVGYRVPW